LGEGACEPVIAWAWLPTSVAQAPSPLTRFGYVEHGTLHKETHLCSEQFMPVAENSCAALRLRDILSSPDLPHGFKFRVSDQMKAMTNLEGHVFSAEDDEQGEGEDALLVLPSAVLQTVISDFDLLATRLKLERPAIYEDYDRLRSEAQLRFSVFGPLTLLMLQRQCYGARGLYSRWLCHFGYFEMRGTSTEGP
jgi:hypothetical protein